MSRITLPDPIPAASQTLLEGVSRALGMIPNLYKVIARSPVVLDGYLKFSGAAGKVLDVKTRERIALATAEVNGCDYCLSAHSFIAANLAKLDETEIARARHGRSADARADAAVAFAKRVAETRGRVSDADLAAVRAASFNDGQIVEIIAVVVENFFTNLINNVAGTDIDFPHVRTAAA